MKKFLSVIFTVLCAFMLVACGADDLSSTYGLDKEVKIKEEVTLEAAKEEVSQAKDEGFGKYFSIYAEIVEGEEKMEYEMKCDISDSENYKFYMVIKTTAEGKEEEFGTYITDGIYYLNDEDKKVKVDISKYGSLFGIKDLVEYFNTKFSEYANFDEIFSELQVTTEGLVIGKDSKGNLVIEYTVASVQERCVFDGAKLIFSGYKTATGYANMTFNYSKSSIKFPDFSEYESFSLIG